MSMSSPVFLLGLVASLAAHAAAALAVPDLSVQETRPPVVLTMMTAPVPAPPPVSPRPVRAAKAPRFKPTGQRKVRPPKSKRSRPQRQVPRAVKPLDRPASETEDPLQTPPLATKKPERVSLEETVGTPQALTEIPSTSRPGPSAAERHSALDKYLRAVRSGVRLHKRYPYRARRFGMEGTVRLRFRIGAQGDVSRVSIVSPALSPLLTQEATRAVGAAGPFAPLPPELGDYIEVEVPIVFRLAG